MRQLPVLIALLLCAATPGCSQRSLGAPQRPPDSGAPPDAAAGPDLYVPAGCVGDCYRQGLHKCAKDAAGRCVECTADAHCVANPGALGNRCDTSSSLCVCAADADCTGKLHGARCQYGICSCASDSDCGAPARCIKSLFVARVCARPCAADSQCTSPQAPLCDAQTGLCFSCKADADCQRGHQLGGRCIKPAAGGDARCGCASDKDCASNARGPRCDGALGRCTCRGGADCKADYSRCGRPHAGASFRECQRPCQGDHSCGAGLSCLTSGVCAECRSDGDCADPAASRCNTALAACVQCRSNAHCASSQAATTHCEVATGKCVECLNDAQCKGARRWGNRCLKDAVAGRHCRCIGAADCAGNSNGPSCDKASRKCGCVSKGQCAAPYSACRPPYAGATYSNCQKPCQADRDCVSLAAPFCDASSGACAACVSVDHCRSGASPVCSGSPGKCGKCTNTQQCAGSLQGSLCEAKSGTCKCATHEHCKGRGWGNRCDASPGRCSCLADADCAGNTNGPLCDVKLGRCGCKASGDCKIAPFITCAAPHASATHLSCQRKCAVDADCVAPLLSTCAVKTGQCVQCQVDADCASPFKRRCHAGSGLCVECASDKDCAGSSKKRCNVTLGRCLSCASHVQCASNKYKRYCDLTSGCVECGSSAHCDAASLGQQCSAGSCVCQSHAQCANNVHGSRCLAMAQACGCINDADCPAGKKCTGSTGFSRSCKKGA